MSYSQREVTSGHDSAPLAFVDHPGNCKGQKNRVCPHSQSWMFPKHWLYLKESWGGDLEDLWPLWSSQKSICCFGLLSLFFGCLEIAWRSTRFSSLLLASESIITQDSQTYMFVNFSFHRPNQAFPLPEYLRRSAVKYLEKVKSRIHNR